MKINNTELSLSQAIEFSNYEGLLLKRRENNIMLSDYQISVLNRNGIDYRKFCGIRELLFEVENCLYVNFDEELDIVSSQLAEYIYYNETKK